jgi:hypothetical protein
VAGPLAAAVLLPVVLPVPPAPVLPPVAPGTSASFEVQPREPLEARKSCL